MTQRKTWLLALDLESQRNIIGGHLRVIKGKIDNTRITRLIIGKDG
jgi:hypothetical protein